MINQDGLSFESWPKSLEDNRFYSSPIIFDLDKNGKEDIITIDDEGIIRVLSVISLFFCLFLVDVEVTDNRSYFYVYITYTCD